jgi:hypothetical protein
MTLKLSVVRGAKYAIQSKLRVQKVITKGPAPGSHGAANVGLIKGTIVDNQVQ